jgi:hypothetical protein
LEKSKSYEAPVCAVFYTADIVILNEPWQKIIIAVIIMFAAQCPQA